MSNKRVKQSGYELPGFAGIALADILANGVAIIILMIIISLNIKNQAEEEMLEKAKDITLLLSREIAPSVVMNALPTSPPAILHHYSKSSIDRYPQQRYMPILELHEKGVRNFYSKNFWLRKQLFLSDNLLDGYLSHLSSIQRRNIRLDVYSIKNFYLLMSIIKSHDITIKHWHFNGEHNVSDEALLAMNIAMVSGSSGVEDNEVHQKDATDKKKSQYYDTIPGDIIIDGNEQHPSGYPESIMEKKWIDLTAADNQIPARGHFPYVNKKRSSVYVDQQHMLSVAKKEENAQPEHTEEVRDYRNILAFLFESMVRLQYRTDQGDYGVLDNFSLGSELVSYIYSFPKISEFRAHIIETVFYAINSRPKLPLTIKHNKDLHVANIHVKVNGRIDTININGHARVDANEKTPEISVRLGVYPAVFEGITLPITADSVILVPPENIDHHGFKWRLITLVNPVLGQSHLGYVYSAFNQRNSLVISAEENSVMVNHQSVTRIVAIEKNRNKKMLFVFYAILAAFIIIIILRSYKK